MLTTLSKFTQMANATRQARAEEQAEEALKNSQENPLATKTHHLSVLFSALRALPMAENGVSFKGGIVGDKGAIVYADTYSLRNGTSAKISLNFDEDTQLFTQNGKHPIVVLTEQDEDRDAEFTVVRPCYTQIEALGYIAAFLGQVAPEREAEILPLLQNAEYAILNQTQMENKAAGNEGRWSARRGSWHDGPYGGSISPNSK